MSDKEQKQRRHSVQTYVICLLTAVIALVLVSYFAQQRNHQSQIDEYSQTHSTQINQLNTRMDELETRIHELENNK